MVHNPNNLYTGGAVEFNSQPQVNVYAQLLQRKQAKDDAIDEYYRKLPMTINKAGMRDQEAAILDSKLADWQKHWMENKDKIRKGNSQEAFDSDKKFRDIQFFVQDSKNDAKTSLEVGKWRFSKDKEYVFQDPDFLEAVHAHDLPIGTPGHISMDLGKVAIPPRPLDATEQNKIWNTVTNGIKPTGKEYDESKQTSNPVTGLVAVPYVKKFRPEQIKGIAENMGKLAATDRDVKSHYNNILYGKDAGAVNKLQQAYSSVYKDDIMDSPEKVAKADAILRASVPQEEGEDFRPDVQYRNQLALSKQKIMEAVRQGNRKEMAGIRRGWQILDQQAQNEILSNVFEGYKNNPNTIPEDLLEDYKKKDDKGHKVDFSQVTISPDGTKVQMIVTDGKGKPIPEYSSEANVSDLKERTRKKIETVQTNVVNTGTSKNQVQHKKVYNPKTGKFE